MLGPEGAIVCSVAACAILWKIIGAIIYRYARHMTTIIDDLPQLGLPRSGEKMRGTAVIAGGSFAGVLAARVLSRHFEKVVVIEPDSELERKRSRVGQWNQLHGFLPILRLVLLQLFPDFDVVAEQTGHRIIPLSGYGVMNFEGKPILIDPSKFPPSLDASRMSLERVVRTLLRSHCPDVTFVAGQVAGVQVSTDQRRIGSVQVKKGGDSTKEDIETSFFVDCTGPACGSSQWLPRANPGWVSNKDSYDPRVGYSTGIYKLTPDQMAAFNAKLPVNLRDTVCFRQLYGSTKSASQLGFGALHYETNSVVLLAFQWGHVAEYPETVDDYIEFAKRCEVETSEVELFQPFYDAMEVFRDILGEERSQAKTLQKYSVTGMYHRRFDMVPSLPHNFAVVGDALMRLNPIFGQGCAKAGQDVTSLDAELRRCTSSAVPDGFAKRLLKIQTPRDRVFFDSTRINDYRYPTTIPMEGETLSTGKFQRKFGEAVLRLAHKDVDAGSFFGKSVNNLEPSIMLLKPSFVIKVIWNALVS